MSMKNLRFGLTNTVIQALCKVVMQFATVEQVVIYGSRVKGSYKHGSDIDLCLFGDNIDLLTKYAVEQAIDNLDLPYKCDITVYHMIDNEELKDHITRVGIIIATNE